MINENLSDKAEKNLKNKTKFGEITAGLNSTIQ